MHVRLADQIVPESVLPQNEPHDAPIQDTDHVPGLGVRRGQSNISFRRHKRLSLEQITHRDAEGSHTLAVVVRYWCSGFPCRIYVYPSSSSAPDALGLHTLK